MDYFDCHADTLTALAGSGESLWDNRRDVDLKRVGAFGGRYTQIFAIWEDWANIPEGQVEQHFRMLYEKAAGKLEQQARHIALCRNAADMQAAHKSGKAAAFLSIEDISVMGGCAEMAAELGFRFAMLSWNAKNRYACGAVAGQRQGLTEEGRTMVEKLLRDDIVLDISHLSDAGVEDVFSMTDRPVMASHSNVRELCDVPRNLEKSQIKELIRRNGLIGINFYAPFIGGAAGVEELLRHMDAILALGGEDVLALGGDFDGCGGNFPAGITGVESMPYLRERMERAGYSASLVDRIFFGNANRFIRHACL